MDDNINSIRQFLDEFRETNVEENVKHRSSIISSFHMNPEDVKAEVLDWSMHYLEQKKCPYSLALMLSKLVAHQLSDSVYEMSLQSEEGIDDEDDSKRFRYESSQLYTEMIECLLEACTNWQDHVDINAVKIEPPPRIVSMSAIKNGRRKMEDRHVIIHDLNTVCGLKDVPQHSYYAVFDGHAGVEAASYCTAHLHWNIVNHSEFLSNTEKAIYEAVILTDRNLLERSCREGIKGGCTVLCCLIRDKVMYVAWVGDSQAVLVKQGTPVPIGLPHKPDREDERCRVEELGGCILFLGTWRVNGTLAVSRALGDAEHKPYISNEPEVLKIPLDGTEDYIVLACDGLWDQLQPSDVGQVVYDHIIEGAENVDNVASKLVQLSKSQGSTDNITTIVVFLKDPHNISKSDPVFPQLQNKSEEKDSQINGTSLSDNFLNSEEITKQTVTTADPTANGVSSIEQFKNELNSLNFPQSTATLSHLQEKSLTSEVLMQQYEESCITPSLLAYENPSLPNYCSTDTTFSSPQSPSNSANSSISQISDSFDLSQHIIVEKEEHNINANILSDSSIAMTSFLNFTNNHAKEDANLNQLVTASTEQNVGEDYLLGGTAHGNKPKLNGKEVSMPSNNFTELEENSEFSREVIMQTVTDLQINPAIVLPDINNDTVMQLSEGIVFRNNNEVLNSQTPESCKNEVLPNISPDNCVATVDQPNDLYETINSVTVNNNFQTEIKVSNSDLLHSTNVENFYRQEETSNLTLKEHFNVIDDQLNLNTETDKIRNDTFNSETEDSSINLNTKKFSPHSLDLSGCEKNETVLEFPLTCDSVTGNQLSTHFIVDNVAVVNNAQTGNEILTNALDKSNYLLQSPDQTDSDKLEIAMEVISEKCVSIIGTEISPLDETIDTALNNNLKLENKAVGLICSPVSFQENKQLEETEVLSNNEENFSNSNIVQNFDKNQTATPLPSQNYNNFTDCKLDLYNKTDNTTINDSIQLDIKTSNNNKSNSSFHSTQGTISDELEIAANISLDTCANITDNGLSTRGSDATGDNFLPDIETCSHKPNKEDSLLIDMSDFNKFELLPELPSQVCVNNAGDTSNTYNCAKLTNVPQSNNENFSSVELGNASETCTTLCMLDTDVLHKVKDVDISLTEQDTTESKFSLNLENTHNVPPTTESMKHTECPSKDETQPIDNLTRQPKYDQVEKIPIFESLAKQASNKTSSIQTSDLSTKGNTGHPLPHGKLFAKPDNKTVSSKKSTVKALTTTSSIATNRQRQIPPKPVKSSSIKPVQAQQLKAKQTITNNDVKPVCEPDVKSSVATKPKSIQPNVFERLSSPKVAFTKSKEIKNRENLYSSKGISGTSTKAVPEAKARNNMSQTNKALGATPKKFNAQSHLSENVKSKPQTSSTTVSNSNLNIKTPRLLSNQVTTSKAQKGTLSQKTDEKLLPQSKVPNVKKPSSNTEVASTKKSVSTNRQDTSKQRLPLNSKIAERALVNASSRQATPFRPVASTKLDMKRVGVVSNQQSGNSNKTSRAAVERSSTSSAKMKEGKAAVAKSSVLQKKESNSTEKTGKKCQIQKTSATDQKKNGMPNMDGQGDCVASNKDSHLPEINGKDIELPKSDVNNSKEVPNPTLDG